ncbi:MAG: ribosomal RNA small subunit methyltransferase A [Kiritimatiellae bacterium]|nr:ribosomal RNA small subunit methyltransferase A [Kiritimatiellia bacterium]
MNLVSPPMVRNLLDELNVHPSKALGQNFLVDRNVLTILLKALTPGKEDNILEIGPGLGVITERIVKKCSRVIAVEKDRRLYQHLSERFQTAKNVSIVCADIMDMDIRAVIHGAFTGGSVIDKIVSNLPYSVGSRILMDIVRLDFPPAKIVITVQKEVADRLSAEAGTKVRGLLGVWAQLLYDVTIVKTVSRTCFLPRPEVESAIVQMNRRDESELTSVQRKMFYGLTKFSFTQRRKRLTTVLHNAPGDLHVERGRAKHILSDMGISESVRPEEISNTEWCGLVKKCYGRI